MGFPSVTYTFANSTTADATQVNQNFTDIINGLSDGTKNINVSAGTFAGTLNAQGAVTLGASTANLVTFNGSLTSSIPVATTNSYDIGSDTFGLASVYLGSGSSAHSTRLKGAAVSSAYTFTLPNGGGTSGYVLQTDGTGVTSWGVVKRSNDAVQNYALASSVNASAMTIALKSGAGTDPSASDTVDVVFRNATAATGTPNVVSITAAMSVVIPSGATLGLTSAVNQYIHVYLVQDTSNELAVSGQRLFDDGSLQSCTAITSGSTSASVLYSTSTHTSRPVRYLGRIQSNQVTSGTYAAGATEIASSPLLLPVMTDWLAYTPAFTGFGTAASISAFWRRVGDTVQVKGRFKSGTSTGVNAQISLPLSLTWDANKLPPNQTATLGILVRANGSNTAFPASGFGPWVITADSGTSTSTVQISTTSNNTADIVYQIAFGNAILASGDTASFSFEVPISTWSSSR